MVWDSKTWCYINFFSHVKRCKSKPDLEKVSSVILSLLTESKFSTDIFVGLVADWLRQYKQNGCNALKTCNFTFCLQRRQEILCNHLMWVSSDESPRGPKFNPSSATSQEGRIRHENCITFVKHTFSFEYNWALNIFFFYNNRVAKHTFYIKFFPIK